MLPSFETDRLLLRQRSMAEFEACLAMDRDPEVTKYIPGPWNEPLRHELFLKARIEKSLGPGLGYWSIFPKDQPHHFVGWILLIPYDGIGPDIEVGWRLNRLSWGRGYATEAAAPVLTYAFDALGTERIVAEIDPRNVASLRVAEKLGMRLAGGEQQDGSPHKFHVMTMAEHRRRKGVALRS